MKKLFGKSKVKNQGIYIDIVKRPVRNRPRPIEAIKVEARRQKRNAAARAKRAARNGVGNGKQVVVQ